MIKFFRKIRQKLIIRNNFSKYLIYAIGEIVLVVFGILIALQINNWNEANKINNKEVVYLNNIVQDLNLNIASLKEFIAERQKTVNSAEALLECFEGKPISDLHEFNFHNVTVMVWYPFVQHANTFNELMNSGNFSIISDKAVKNDLQDMQSSYLKISFIENEMQQDYERYLYEVYFNQVDLNNSLKSFANHMDNKEFNDIEIDRSEINTLLKSKLFKNGLVLASYNSQLLTEEYGNMIERTRQLIDRINEQTVLKNN
jgi:hypothetical protein